MEFDFNLDDGGFNFDGLDIGLNEDFDYEPDILFATAVVSDDGDNVAVFSGALTGPNTFSEFDVYANDGGSGVSGTLVASTDDAFLL